MGTQRRLAAIMFTDIVGFSAIMQKDESFATILRHRHRSVFREMHEKYGGEILQYFGDGTLSIFDSASSAVECAVAMQIEFQKHPEVPLRIGIHSGDIAYDDEGAYGDGLNIASRIERRCIPGAVYISAKVYDDIKNHSWLEAISLGHFELRNIQKETEIYVIANSGLPVPDPDELQATPPGYQLPPQEIAGEFRLHRKKNIAALLALFFGIFGVHRFYLGQTFRGILYFAITAITFIATIEEGLPFIALMGVIGFIDAILLFAMADVDFEQKYNYAGKRKRRKQKREIYQPAYEGKKTKATPTKKQNPYLRQGIQLYRKGSFEEAIQAFNKALDFEPGNVAVYFNLACSYSSLRKTRQAFENLEQAINHGLTDIKLIHTHPGLSYIRRLDSFQRFLDNDFRYLEQLPPPKESILDKFNEYNPEVLDRLELLGEQLEQGALSREEFEARKKEILKRE